MNQSIRTAPLPFLKVNGEAAAEAPPCTETLSGETSQFGDLLNAELDESASQPQKPSEQEEKAKKGEAVEVYGIAPVLLLLTPPAPVAAAVQSATAPPEPAPENTAPTTTNPDLAATDPSTEKASPSKAVIDLQPPNPEASRISLPAAAEQKVPTPPKEVLPQPEQITGKPPESAKKSHGMVVAQPPPMLMTSQQEKNAPQGQPLALQHVETAAFEPAVRVELLQAKPMRSEKVEVIDPAALESELPEMPRFEVVSGEIELQPARPVEPTSVVDAIRTHIELLKTSSAEKLDVVLRPDSNTELRLIVEKVDGVIQVQARCDRGDFAALEANWNTIQHTLASQGVRVEPLQQGSGAQFHQNGNFQNFSGQGSHHHEERPAFSIEQEFTNREGTRPTQSKHSKGTRGSAVKGWQSWA